MKVRISGVDIDLGIRQNPNACPIALAVRRVYPGAYVAVTPSHVIIHSNGKVVEDHRLPLEATEFVHAFDEGKPVEPLEFEL